MMKPPYMELLSEAFENQKYRQIVARFAPYAGDAGISITYRAINDPDRMTFNNALANIDLYGDKALPILEKAIERIPGVTSAAYTTVNPLCCGDWGAPLAVEGRVQPEGSTHLIHHRLVGPGYFEATGTPLLRGRDFDGRDTPGAPGTVIVDNSLAQRFWPDEDALGKRIRLDRPDTEWLTIVGVVETIKHNDLTAPESEHVGAYYFSARQSPRPFLSVVARAATEPSALTPGIRAALARIDPDRPRIADDRNSSLKQRMQDK